MAARDTNTRTAHELITKAANALGAKRLGPGRLRLHVPGERGLPWWPIRCPSPDSGRRATDDLVPRFVELLDERRSSTALRLNRDDIDWARGVLAIRESNFGRSRRVPVLESTVTVLDRYGRVRDQFCARTTSSSFLVSMTGTRIIYRIVQQTFRRLCDQTRGAALARRASDWRSRRVTSSASSICRES